MAKDIQSKKRKASVPEVEAEKVKVKNVVASSTEAAPAKKRKANEDVAPAKVKKTKTKPAKTVTEESIPAIAPKKSSKATTNATVKNATKDTTTGSTEASVAVKEAVAPKTKTTVPKKTTASKKMGNNASRIEAPKPEIDVDEEMEEDSGLELDDETLDILKGFESEGDDKEIDDGFPEGAEVPARKKLSKKEEKELKKIKQSAASDKPGVVYVSRIPHGFFENEMKAYFNQFGKITRLRLSRNKKSGASKHFAWIEFESAEVADIVARTMDNYMMFGHLLKVKLIPAEQVNEKWFVGANKRFKRVPWNRMEGRKLEQPKSEETWNSKNDREAEKREKKAAQMKSIGYEVMTRTLKSATGVAKPKAPEELTSVEGEVEVTEVAPSVEQATKSKKGKKGKKGQEVSKDEDAITTTPSDKTRGATPEVTALKAQHRAVEFPPSPKSAQETFENLVAATESKKPKKAKADEVVDEEAKPKKEKKTKKAKAVKHSDLSTAEPSVPENELLPIDAVAEMATITKKKSNKRKASA